MHPPLAQHSPRSAADAVRYIFAKADSLLKQLVYFSTAENPQTGRYADPLLSLSFDAKDIDKQLRQQQCKAFAAWVQLSIEEQHAELEEFLAGEREARALLQQWIQQEWYERLIPPGTPEPDKDMFLNDFGIIAALVYSGMHEEAATP